MVPGVSDWPITRAVCVVIGYCSRVRFAGSRALTVSSYSDFSIKYVIRNTPIQRNAMSPYNQLLVIT
jgi:hypothetical protein